LETQLLEEDFLVGLGLRVAAEDQGASIGGWEVNIEHLDGGELVEDAADGFNARSMAATSSEQSMPLTRKVSSMALDGNWKAPLRLLR
jgi:hypothetical protein